MEDITPSLLKSIQDDFQKGFDKSSTISRLYAKVRDGTATYEETNDFAIEVGEILAGAYKKNLSSSVLPDGRMYYNIANRIITPTMTNNYNLIVAVTKQVQEALNKSAGIGIKAIVPKQNTDRIKGIVDKVSDAENYDDVAWVLDEPIINHAQSIVADSIKANAEFQYEAGLSPKIVRKSTGKCCEWCNTVVGVYEYPNVPKDVYRRHDHCRCSVNYIAGKKKVDVHHGNTGKRRYVKDEYGSYVLSKDARIERAKQMQATEKERKEVARQKRIATWAEKRNLKDDSLDHMGTAKIQEIEIAGKKFAIKTYKNDDYSNIWCQTYSKQSKEMCKFIDQEINKTGKYGEISQIVVAKNKTLQGIASYDHRNNILFICEELIDKHSFAQIVDKSFFAAEDINDVLTHELGGHKAHWENVYNYFRKNSNRFQSEYEAKEELESALRKYVKMQRINNPMYIENTISKNANMQFAYRNVLNEIIADGKILIEKNLLKDIEMERLIKEVLSYDGYAK